MQNFHKFVNYKPCTDCVIISCKLGYWQVKGSYSIDTARQAEQKYLKFCDLGKYKNIPKEKKNENSIKRKSENKPIRFKTN